MTAQTERTVVGLGCVTVGGWMGARTAVGSDTRFGPHGYIAMEDARDTVDGLGKRPECSDAQIVGHRGAETFGQAPQGDSNHVGRGRRVGSSVEVAVLGVVPAAIVLTAAAAAVDCGGSRRRGGVVGGGAATVVVGGGPEDSSVTLVPRHAHTQTDTHRHMLAR